MARGPKEPPPPVPATLGDGRYELKQALGLGGMAAVYRALDRWEQKEIAIKVLLPHASRSDKHRSRFLKEARTMSQLDHPNIVHIFDVGQQDTFHYAAMELCKGGNLATYLKQHGPLSTPHALKVIIQVLRALEYAHLAGVVHRDIKPHNVLFTTTEYQVVKLADFGIARVIRSTSSRITATGDTLGTLAYMPPEQRRDASSVGPSADLYAAGATLYLLVTGRRPLELAVANTDEAVLGRLPPLLRGFISRATAPTPEGRFVDAAVMRAHAMILLEQAGEDDSPPLPELPPKLDPDADTTIVELRDETT